VECYAVVVLVMLYTTDEARFRTSAAKQMRTALFWAITQRVVAIPYRRFGRTYRPYWWLRNNPDERISQCGERCTEGRSSELLTFEMPRGVHGTRENVISFTPVRMLACSERRVWRRR